MLALGLGVGHSLGALPALLTGNGLPNLPVGWAFLTLGQSFLRMDGRFLIVETN